MTIAATVQGAASAVTPANGALAHTVTAAALGGGFSSFVVWCLQTFAHVVPPDSVDQWLTALGVVCASWLLQRLAQ